MRNGENARRPSSIREASPQRRHRPDHAIMVYVGLIMLLGLIIMYAIGPQRAEVLNAAHGTDYYTSTYFIVKQTTSLAVALAAMVGMAVMPLSLVKKHAGSVLIAGLVASLLLMLLGNVLHVESIAQCSLGACRWFNLGPLGGFQPAELLKFGMLIYLARFIASRLKEGKLNDWNETLLPIIILTSVASFFVIVVQKDMGTGISVLAIVATMLMAAGINRKFGTRLLLGLLAVGALLIVIAPHRVNRVMTFLQGDEASMQSSDGAAYHITHAKIALGVGGLFGVGIGNSVQATGYLPEAINDSVFAIIGETFGFVGVTILIALFAALLLRLLTISEHLRDPWLRMLAAGLFGWLAAHIVLNIASMIGIFPLTGITLPLLSFGGTSMVFIAAAIGLILQASQYTSHQPLTKEAAYASVRSGRGIGRTRDASSRRA